MRKGTCRLLLAVVLVSFTAVPTEAAPWLEHVNRVARCLCVGWSDGYHAHTPWPAVAEPQWSPPPSLPTPAVAPTPAEPAPRTGRWVAPYPLRQAK